MVRGLDIFRDHFQNYADRYVLIGGAACDIAMTSAGLEFRATKDLDIVLCVEAMDPAFVQAFWDFVRGRVRGQREIDGGEAVLSVPEAQKRELSLHGGIVFAKTRCAAGC